MHTNAYRRPLSPRPHPLHTHSRTHLGKNISARKRVRATDHPFPLSNQQMSNVSWLFSLPCAFPLRLAPRDRHERGGADSAGSANRSIDGRVPARVRSLAKRRQISDSASGRNGLHDPHADPGGGSSGGSCIVSIVVVTTKLLPCTYPDPHTLPLLPMHCSRFWVLAAHLRSS